MAFKSKISWTDSTWNPWYGCLKVSPGCLNCYMYRAMEKLHRNPSIVVRSKPFTFNSPEKWKEPRIIFVCSWSDFFIESADAWRPEAWHIIRHCPQHIFLILTKRPRNIEQRLPAWWDNGPLNVWLGVTVEGDHEAHRIDDLLTVPSIGYFLSYEPALGALDLSPFIDDLQWVIAGGESGLNCRPPNPLWFRSVRRTCLNAKVPFFFKQQGGTRIIEGAFGGPRLDGELIQQTPFQSFHTSHPKLGYNWPMGI